MDDRIGRLAIAQQLEVQMRAGRAAGVANVADQVALLRARSGRPSSLDVGRGGTAPEG